MKQTVAFGLVAMGLCGGCLPQVQSVRERRESFDRKALEGSVLVGKPPEGMTPVGAVFAERAQLLGYTLDPPKPRPGSRVRVRFYWSTLRPMAEEYKVFVHGDAVGEKQSRIHGDHFPAGGRYPTDVWRVGDVIRDEFGLFVPPGYAAKHLGLFIGLYKGNYRVPITDPSGRPRTGDNRLRAVDIFF